MKLNATFGLVIAIITVACAPASQPSSTTTNAKPTAAPTTTPTAPNSTANTRSQRAFEKAPLRTGETWNLAITSADGKNKRSYTIEITGALEYDDKDIEVYAPGKSGNFQVITFYDPSTAQQGIAVYLNKNRDPSLAWCDFNEASRGVTKMIGVSFVGTRSQLNRLLEAGSSSGFGKCVLEKIR
jgi:hypothetical protein